MVKWGERSEARWGQGRQDVLGQDTPMHLGPAYACILPPIPVGAAPPQTPLFMESQNKGVRGGTAPPGSRGVRGRGYPGLRRVRGAADPRL